MNVIPNTAPLTWGVEGVEMWLDIVDPELGELLFGVEWDTVSK